MGGRKNIKSTKRDLLPPGKKRLWSEDTPPWEKKRKKGTRCFSPNEGEQKPGEEEGENPRVTLVTPQQRTLQGKGNSAKKKPATPPLYTQGKKEERTVSSQKGKEYYVHREKGPFP